MKTTVHVRLLCSFVLLTTLLAGCSDISIGGCERGRSSPDDALLAMLSAVHKSDKPAMQQLLRPGFIVDESVFKSLHEALSDNSIESIRLTNADRASTAYFFTALSGKGTLVGNFEVHDLENRCYAVAWGKWDDPGQ